MEPKKESTLRALISLLEDDTPVVRESVLKRLRAYGPTIRGRLRECVESVESPRGRLSVRRLVQELDDNWLANSLCAALKYPGGQSLERSVIALARSEYPDVSELTMRRELDRLAEGLAGRVGNRCEPDFVVNCLRDFFFGELGFVGNRQDYFNPENHYLNRVLVRRTGIQMSLSILYLLVGRRVHLRLDGLAVPGHFLVAYSRGAKRVVVDPFNEGRIVSRAACLNLLSQLDVPFREQYFEQRATTSEIVERMVMNLVGVARRAENWTKQDRLLSLLTKIRRA